MKQVTSGFEVKVNGRRVRRAGLVGKGATLLSFESVAESETRAKTAVRVMVIGEKDPDRTHVQLWRDLKLKVGDVLEVRVLDAGPFDRPWKTKIHRMKRTDAETRKLIRGYERTARDLRKDLAGR